MPLPNHGFRTLWSFTTEIREVFAEEEGLNTGQAQMRELRAPVKKGMNSLKSSAI